MHFKALLIATLFLAGCSADANLSREFKAELRAPYRLDTGDRVRIAVRSEPVVFHIVDLSGNVTVPSIGVVAVRGRSLPEVEAAISSRLPGGNARDVSVEVDRHRPIFAMGAVNATGRYDFVPGMTVQQAISAAGGFTAKADRGSVRVTRAINGEVASVNLKLSNRIMPGDTLYVRERPL
jgi:polysaccharide export outer membrane protein